MKPTRKKPLRRVEVLVCYEHPEDSTRVLGYWKNTKFSKLKKGDIFRLFDTDNIGAEKPDQKDKKGNHVINVALTDSEPQPMPTMGVVKCLPLRGFNKGE